MQNNNLTITLNFDDAAKTAIRKLSDVINRTKFEAELHKQAARLGMDFSSWVKKLYLTNNPIHVRTGRLRNSFGNKLDPHGIFVLSPLSPGHGVAMHVGTSLKYAAPLEYGADIYAKKADGALAIPLEGALTPTGAPRFNWQRRGDIPAQFPDLFPIKSKRGNLLLVRKVGNRITPMFVLKKHVHIEGRHYLQKAAESYFPKMEAELVNWLERFMQ